MTTNMLDAARARALFCCALSANTPLTRAEATAAIRNAVRVNGGALGCACLVAQEFGDHPDTAPRRMAWATRTVADLYGKPSEVIWSRA